MQAAQTELDAVAEDFRKLHAERQALLVQAEGAVANLRKRDEDIRAAGSRFASTKDHLEVPNACLDYSWAVDHIHSFYSFAGCSLCLCGPCICPRHCTDLAGKHGHPCVTFALQVLKQALDLQAGVLARNQEANRNTESQVDGMDREKGRLREAYQAEQQRLSQVLDDVELVKNTLGKASDDLAHQMSTNGQVR